MTIPSVSPCKKMVKFGVSLFRGGFKSSKCKTMAKLATARIKLLRNKRLVVVKQMRRDVALLLQSGQDATARIRVEHVIREQNIMAANEIIELFCELIVARLSIIAKQRECPADLKEGICSLIFSAPRCSDIPELVEMRNIFEKKYGKEFVSAATDLRPDCGVNRTLIEKLSVRTPIGEVKLRLMKEIAKEFQIEWDTTDSEKELLNPPEELIEGPRTFISATSMPVKPVSSQGVEQKQSTDRLTNGKGADAMHFEDMASAAKAAADSAEKAIAAAQAAAYLANWDNPQVSSATGFSNNVDGYGSQLSSKKYSFSNSPAFPMANNAPVIRQESRYHSKLPGRIYESHCFDRSHYLSDEESDHVADNKRVHRRHSYNIPKARSNINFDESESYDRSHYSSNEEPDHAIAHNKRVHQRHSRNAPKSHPSIQFDESQRFDRSHYSSNEESDHAIADNKRVDRMQSHNVPKGHSDIQFDESQNFDRSHHSSNEESDHTIADNKRVHQRNSHNVPKTRSDIQFDESDESDLDCDEEIEMEVPSAGVYAPPNRPPPPLPPSHGYQPDDRLGVADNYGSSRRNSMPGVHPKLPDYETLAARFEALKSRKL